MNLRARYTSSPESAARARKAVVDFACLAGFSGDLLLDIKIAVGEALANAAEHALREGATRFDVRAFIEGGSLVIEVHDDGRGFDTSKQSPQVDEGTDRVRGYGTYLMRVSMDRVEYKFGGTCVRLVKRLPKADGRTRELQS